MFEYAISALKNEIYSINNCREKLNEKDKEIILELESAIKILEKEGKK